MKCKKTYLIALLVTSIIYVNTLYNVGSSLMDEKGPIDIGSIYNINMVNL